MSSKPKKFKKEKVKEKMKRKKPGYTVADIMKEVEELKKENKEERWKNLFRCKECGTPLVKINEYEYKGDCAHIPKGWRLSVG